MASAADNSRTVELAFLHCNTKSLESHSNRLGYLIYPYVSVDGHMWLTTVV
jgi:hypothetical protein